ncbi:hypothetical protein [Micromonospora sp. NPDC005174]|uniref:hypothetical protein n=1 Tax=Micromonospora sp. NPDC005174 TaxID=3157018 RepID=UPI0033A59478
MHPLVRTRASLDDRPEEVVSTEAPIPCRPTYAAGWLPALHPLSWVPPLKT